MDENGYPEPETLERITKWDIIPDGGRGLFEFIVATWHYDKPYARITQKGRVYLSTGGWSGNEDLLGALRDNHLAWGLCWVQSRRGGHYIFELGKWKPNG